MRIRIGRGVREGRDGVRRRGGRWMTVALMSVVLALGVLLAGLEAAAQESQSGTTSGEAAPAVAAPTVAAQPEAITLANSWPDITGLAMQPVYLAVKVALVVVGGLASGATWAATGGKTDEAKRVWDATVPQAWGWPEFVRRLGKPQERAL